ncbi:hypothetical protein MUDAN_DOGOELCO_03321 [Lactiplantibacillus mudanjiangensis]|uniref:hypothetical protein n=1 Tax=Lactiplantibacillus mudanjiangensis TaxID=1296538 RepID=UPI0010153CCA|nr:hypothetical protein [Lactiplantibacillus mudanjiangensis]VDG31477.1 hypothetical protein MUDAN_DOGOELCO_03321 [Lactiplantibacillus mudanjiangensis]
MNEHSGFFKTGEYVKSCGRLKGYVQHADESIAEIRLITGMSFGRYYLENKAIFVNNKMAAYEHHPEFEKLKVLDEHLESMEISIFS